MQAYLKATCVVSIKIGQTNRILNLVIIDATQEMFNVLTNISMEL
jgi:hypothetical protein